MVIGQSLSYMATKTSFCSDGRSGVVLEITHHSTTEGNSDNMDEVSF